MTIKSIGKRSGHWVLFAFIVLCLVSCKDDDDKTTESKPFDPAKPVTVTDFLPKEGGMGQRLVIYGSNFGNDIDIIRVFVGGREAKVIGVEGESLYCLVPQKAFSGDIEVRINSGGTTTVGKAEELFDYKRKLLVSTIIGYKNDRDDQGWKDGKFKDADETKMASGFSNDGFFKFDPANPKHLWATFDHHNGLYLINFEDSTVTKRRSDMDRPRSIDFTLDHQYMILSEDRGGTDDPSNYILPRSRNFSERTVITRYKQCNGSAVHPVNGELYFNSYEKGQFYRFDLNKYFSEGLGVKDFETLFLVHDQSWEYRITIHPTGNYAYIVVVNQHYILRVDYNWSKQRFNQPYLVCGELKTHSWADGVGSSARLHTPYQGVFVKNEEYTGKPDEYDFYFTDRDNHCIRKLTPEGIVTTFAGRGSSSLDANPYGYVDGDLREEARFNAPTGIEYNESEGAFYVSDKENRRIRKIALEDIE